MKEQPLAGIEWSSDVWGNLQSNIDFLVKTNSLEKGLRVLEIGCGKGRMLSFLNKQGLEVTGLDLDADALRQCRESFPNLQVHQGSGDDLPFPNEAFDLVLSFDVFEHIKDSNKHLQEVIRVLKPGGQYLLQTPNKWTNVPFEILRHWKKYRMGPVAGYRELTKEHCALHNYWELQRRFSDNGFSVTIIDIPVVNDHFKDKMKTYFGFMAKPLLTAFNPDRFPKAIRTNFYVKAIRTEQAAR
jgi:ubiquinone/menaquinone biosynthesis C-methylase UbiE